MSFRAVDAGGKSFALLGQGRGLTARYRFENMLQLESNLIAIRVRGQVIEDSLRRLCKDLIDTSICFTNLCAEDKALGPAAQTFKAACASVGSEGFASGTLEQIRDMLQLKLFEPVRANLEVIQEIKARARARDAMRKRLPKSGGLEDVDLAKITSRLFDELSALRQHRMDFIRGPFEALKVANHRFFADAASKLEASALEQTPRPSTGEVAKTQAIRPVPVHAAGTIPVLGKFDPNADRVKAPPAAFARFVHDLPSSSRRSSNLSSVGGSGRISVDSDESDGEFETVL